MLNHKDGIELENYTINSISRNSIPKKNRISLILTVYNEEESINKTLDSIVKQIRQPDEIVIVDGGSTDNTRSIIEKAKSILPYLILIEKSGVNIAEGRNIAIENATHEIIAITDAGCWLHSEWLESIVAPLEADDDVCVVSGFYEASASTQFQVSVAELTFPKLDKVDAESFLPSSRSIALRKSAWIKVGGYPEELETAEDTLFDLRLKRAGYKFAFAANAIVYWIVRKNIQEVWTQFYRYSHGNARARTLLSIHMKQMAIWVSGLILLILGFFDIIFWSILIVATPLYLTIRVLTRTSSRCYHSKCFFFCLLIILVVDLASMIGFISGMVRGRAEFEVIHF